MSNQQLATRDNLVAVCTTIKTPEFQAQIKQALPPGVTIDRFTRVTLTALQQNPAIVNTDRQSLFNAINRCAADGLMPDGKQAALVDFGGKAQYMPMVGGLRNIAAKHGIKMASGVVHKNDKFTYTLGIEPEMTHQPPPLDEDRGAEIGAWAMAKDADGVVYLEVMGKGDIEKVRSVSRSKNNGPWVNQWGEMARKTVTRRLFKSLPITGLDEVDSRILEAADADFDVDAANAASAPAASAEAPVRTGVADRVRKAATKPPINGTATRVEPAPPESSSAVDPDEAEAQRRADSTSAAGEDEEIF